MRTCCNPRETSHGSCRLCTLGKIVIERVFLYTEPMTARGIDSALHALNAARDDLVHHLAVLDLLPIEEQIRIGQEIEAFRNRLNAVDWVLLAAWDRADLA